MKFNGFAEFGLLLASFSYALEKMVEEGGVNITLANPKELIEKKEETFDDIIDEFERLVKETKNISNFTEPVVVEENKEATITPELLEKTVEEKLDEQEVPEEDLAVVNELRKKILDAFKEKETEVEEVFDVASENVTKEETKQFILNPTEDQAEQLRAELINDYNEYIADVKNVYGTKSRFTNAIDSMVEHANIMKDIKKLYPNLEDAFINEYYRLKDAINSENVENKKSVILHRLSFTEKKKLLAYADYLISEGMIVNVNENKLIADVIRPIVTKNGKVMAEIFKVANIAAAYGGFYEGYLVK